MQNAQELIEIARQAEEKRLAVIKEYTGAMTRPETVGKEFAEIKATDFDPDIDEDSAETTEGGGTDGTDTAGTEAQSPQQPSESTSQKEKIDLKEFLELSKAGLFVNSLLIYIAQNGHDRWANVDALRNQRNEVQSLINQENVAPSQRMLLENTLNSINAALDERNDGKAEIAKMLNFGEALQGKFSEMLQKYVNTMNLNTEMSPLTALTLMFVAGLAYSLIISYMYVRKYK